jgi:hypothetical protein
MAYVFLETQSVVLEMSLQPLVATQFYQLESYVAELTYSAQRQPPPKRMKLHLDLVSNAKRLNNSSTYVSQGDLFFAN